MPASAAELAAASRGAAEAGARAVHFHVRGPDGRESLAATDVALAVAALRPLGLPFGVSTGAWIVTDPAERLNAIGRWAALPDFVSVNFHEDGAASLAKNLLERVCVITTTQSPGETFLSLMSCLESGTLFFRSLILSYPQRF